MYQNPFSRFSKSSVLCVNCLENTVDFSLLFSYYCYVSGGVIDHFLRFVQYPSINPCNVFLSAVLITVHYMENSLQCPAMVLKVCVCSRISICKSIAVVVECYLINALLTSSIKEHMLHKCFNLCYSE